MNKPATTFIGTDLHRYNWTIESIQVDAIQLHAGRDGEIICDLEVTSSREPTPGLLSSGRFNLRSITTRDQWQRRLEKRIPDGIDWAEVMEVVCKKSTEHFRSGEPTVDLRTLEPKDGPRDAIVELLDGDGVTTFAGDGGSAKSTFMLAAAVSVASGCNLLDAQPIAQGPAMVFDWEDNSSSYGDLFRAICRGAGLNHQDVPVHYQRMTSSLVESVSQIRRKIADVGAVVSVVDALGAARNGDPESAEVTIRLFNAMRSLGIPVGAIDHLAKNATDKSKPFGSVYTWNMSRRVWGVVKAQDEGQNRLTVSLTNFKSNRARLAPRRGYHIDYEVDHDGRPVTIAFTPCDVRDVPAFASKMGQKDQIIGVLRANVGAMTTEDISAALEAEGTILKDNAIRVVLNRYKDTFAPVPDGRIIRWGLLSKAYAGA